MCKTCSVEGCNNKHCAKGYCDKHYRQFKRYGKILERTKFDLNEIIECDDHAEIVLYNEDNKEIDRALIDLEDIDSVKDYKWYLNSSGYATNNRIGSLHRVLKNPPEGMVIDHVNHNKLDNRRDNLRICTHQQNDWNKPIISTNTSGVTGVAKTQWNTWQARIEVNGKRITIGSFKTKEEAIEARIQAEIDYYGEFSPNNNSEEPK